MMPDNLKRSIFIASKYKLKSLKHYNGDLFEIKFISALIR